MIRHSLLLFFLTVLISFNAVAGWVITEQSTNKYGHKTFQTTFIEGNHIRLDAPTLVSIFDVKANKIILLFPQDRAYWEGTADQLQSQFRDMMAKQIQIIISHAPETQKDTLQKIYQNLIENKLPRQDSIKNNRTEIQVEKTNKTSKILGYTTNLYEVKVDSVLLERIWVTNQLKPYAGISVREALQLTNAINPFSNGVSIPVSKDYIDLLQNGAVLKREFYKAGKEAKSAEVSEIKQAKIIETIFEIPANYELMNIEQVMNLDMNRNVLNPVLQNKEQRINLSPPPPFKSNNKLPDKNIRQ